jgi:hypothetical protein
MALARPPISAFARFARKSKVETSAETVIHLFLMILAVPALFILTLASRQRSWAQTQPRNS